MLQLGLTWPLQRRLRISVPYGAPADRALCWDAHCITLRGRSSLLLVHCATRYTCVRFDMAQWEWAALAQTAREEIRCALLDAGLGAAAVERCLAQAGEPMLTRTHGRREVAFLNRAWEDVLAADFLVDAASQRQPVLNAAVNSVPCRCAGFEGKAAAADFLRRCFA